MKQSKQGRTVEETGLDEERTTGKGDESTSTGKCPLGNFAVRATRSATGTTTGTTEANTTGLLLKLSSELGHDVLG